MADEDDRAKEWEHDEPAAKTILTDVPLDAIVGAVPEEITKPNDLTPVLEEARARGREEGCRSCYAEGQADALVALRSLMLEKGASNEETDHTLAAVRLRLTKL